MRKYEVWTERDLNRKVVIECPDDWSLARAETAIVELVNMNELEWDVDDDLYDSRVCYGSTVEYTSAEDLERPADFMADNPKEKDDEKVRS